MADFQVLLVEDDFLVAKDIQAMIENAKTGLGFKVSAIIDNGKEAINEVVKNRPDLAIMDIRIKGEIDGIETASQLARDHNIPIIYLTDQTDEETFERAKHTLPDDFLTKPVTPGKLRRSIELAITKAYTDQKKQERVETDLEQGKVLNKHYMLKNKDGLHAIHLESITCLIAERSYCHLHTEEKSWHITKPLKEILARLHQTEFCREHIIRINKSYAVNLSKITTIKGNKVFLGEQEFTFGESYRSLLFKYIEAI